MTNPIRNFSLARRPMPRWCVSLAWIAVLGLMPAGRLWAADAVPPRAERPRLGVSVFHLGEHGGAADINEVIEALSEWADAAPLTSPNWHTVPTDAPPDGWVSLVITGFKRPVSEQEQTADGFAFLFDPADNAVKAVAHLPYAMSYNWNARSWYWSVPVEKLCDLLQRAYVNAPEPLKMEPLRLKAFEVIAEGGEQPLLPGMTVRSDEPRLNARMAMPQISAMATAAAAMAGRRPRLVQDDDPDIALGVSMAYHAVSVYLRDTVGDRSWTTHDVPIETLAGRLARDFIAATSEGAIYAVAKVDGETVLGGASGNLCVTKGSGIALLNGWTGAEIWSQGMDARPPHIYASREVPGSAPEVYRIAPGLGRIDVRTGEVIELAPVAPDHAWGFDLAADRIAVALSSALSVFREGEMEWTIEETATIDCGPRFVGTAVVAGTSDGSLAAWSMADGQEIWRRSVGVNLRGPIVSLEERAVVWCEETETLIAVDPRTGDTAWRLPVGDRLVATIQVVGGRLLVAAKDNWIRLLDGSNGDVVASLRWRDWLVDCRAIEIEGQTVIITLDIADSLTILDPETLAVRRIQPLSARPMPGIVYLPEAPASWRDADRRELALIELLEQTANASPQNTRSGVLVTDRQGYVYLFDPQFLREARIEKRP